MLPRFQSSSKVPIGLERLSPRKHRWIRQSSRVPVFFKFRKEIGKGYFLGTSPTLSTYPRVPAKDLAKMLELWNSVDSSFGFIGLSVPTVLEPFGTLEPSELVLSIKPIRPALNTEIARTSNSLGIFP